MANMRLKISGILAAALLAGAAQADAPGLQPLKAPLASPQAVPTASVIGWGDSHVACAEWTNGCVICKRGEAGTAACSTPGIACQPKAIACSRQSDKKP